MRLALVAALQLFACGQKREDEKAREKPDPPAADPAAPADPAAAAKAPATSPAGSAGAPSGMCPDFAACREACAARRPGACMRMQSRLGARDSDRAGADSDRAEAEKVANDLCDAGHAEACHVRFLQLGSERSRAARARTRACDLGYGPACIALADTTTSSAKAAELRGRAATLLDRTCQHDDAYACTALGRVEPAKARWYFDRACHLGDEEGCLALVELLGGHQPELEIVLLDRACELGEPRACARVGDEYATGKNVARNMQRAAGAWQQACDGGANGAARACESLASALADGRLPADAARASALRKRAEKLAGRRDPK